MMQRSKAVIIDYRADDEIIDGLKRRGYEVIFSMENLNVSPNLSGHPDMQICKCRDNVYICCPECYEYYKTVLKEYDVKIIKGNTYLDSNYPGDVAYNVAWIGNNAVHNFRHTDSAIVDYCTDNNIGMINVSQGYSKCSICVVGDTAVITSDKGVFDCLRKYGIDVLQVSEGNIDIVGWDFGFIGGTSGKLDGNTLAFCGDISEHPDYNKIYEFCSKHGVDCVSLSKKRLFDLGSLILIDI